MRAAELVRPERGWERGKRTGRWAGASVGRAGRGREGLGWPGKEKERAEPRGKRRKGPRVVWADWAVLLGWALGSVFLVFFLLSYFLCFSISNQLKSI